MKLGGTRHAFENVWELGKIIFNIFKNFFVGGLVGGVIAELVGVEHGSAGKTKNLLFLIHFAIFLHGVFVIGELLRRSGRSATS